MRPRASAAALLFAALAYPAAAAERSIAERAVAATAMADDAVAIRLDGELNDAAWQHAPVVSEFVQRDPREGAAASFRTEARIIYNSSGLYIGVRAFDPEPAKISGFLTRRDEQSASDWIRVLIDSYHDRRTAYEFAVNPMGVKQDSYWFDDGNSDRSWDAVWDVVVSRDAEGWRAEFHIPFSQLRFSAESDGRVGFAVVREVARLRETSSWPLLAKSASGYVSSFGELTGLTGRRVSKRLELVPYAVSQVVTVPPEEGNPLQNPTDPGAAIGLDLKYAITPALNFTATVNPDFGQVEADPAVVNLSAFETFFAERRPFFVEGSGTYQFGLDCDDGECTGLFYSRRIGRQPRGEPDLPDQGGFSVIPQQSTILGAGKLTGRIGRFSVGALTAMTQKERADVSIGGRGHREVVEPLTFYAVSRARREFPDQSSVGFMLTTTKREAPQDVSFLPGSAVTGGIDYDWRVGRRFNLTGYWAGSTVRGGPEAIQDLQENNVHSYQRPDADHVELDPLATSLNGHAGQIALGKIAGQRVRFWSGYSYKTPGFEINDVGFLRRADERTQSNWLQVRWETPGKYVRSTRINFNQYSQWNSAGDRLGFGGNVNMHWQFQNFWTAGFGTPINRTSFDDRLTRGGPGGLAEDISGLWSYFGTDERKPVSFELNHLFMANRKGSRKVDIWPRLQFRPTSALFIQAGVQYTGNKADAQWIENLDEDTDRPHYVFGRLDQHTLALTGRVNYTITPTLSLQVYGQPFMSAGRYDDYKELVNGRAPRYEDRYRPFAYEDNADFNVLSFRTTNVLRWELKPGSTLFVVWQQGREDDDDDERGDFRFRRDFRRVFTTPANNTVLVKFAYWFNM